MFRRAMFLLAETANPESAFTRLPPLQIFNAFTKSFIPVSGPRMKHLTQVGFSHTATGFLVLANDNAFREFARHIFANRNNPDTSVVEGMLKQFPRPMQGQLLRILRSSSDVPDYINRVRDFLRDSEKSTSNNTKEINFGNEDDVGEKVKPSDLSSDQKMAIFWRKVRQEILVKAKELKAANGRARAHQAFLERENFKRRQAATTAGNGLQRALCSRPPGAQSRGVP